MAIAKKINPHYPLVGPSSSSPLVGQWWSPCHSVHMSLSWRGRSVHVTPVGCMVAPFHIPCWDMTLLGRHTLQCGSVREEEASENEWKKGGKIKLGREKETMTIFQHVDFQHTYLSPLSSTLFVHSLVGGREGGREYVDRGDVHTNYSLASFPSSPR